MIFGINHRIAKPFSYLIDRGFTRLDDLPCDNVGINDWHAKLGECISDGRLAAGDSASQANSKRSFCVSGGHSEHQIQIGVLNRLTPQHRYPASGGEIRAKGNGDIAVFTSGDDHNDIDGGTHDGRQHDYYGQLLPA